MNFHMKARVPSRRWLGVARGHNLGERNLRVLTSDPGAEMLPMCPESTQVNMASPAGVEPATYALGGRRAILLCHGDLVRAFYQ